MAKYKSRHTGQQIDAGVDAALNPDTAVTEDSDSLVTSGAVAAKVNPTITKVNSASATPASGGTDLFTTGGAYALQTAAAAKADLTDIIQTGTTCTEMNGIAAGVYFYLNGDLVCAKTAIANGATFTLNINYEYPSAGALNALKSAFMQDFTLDTPKYVGPWIDGKKVYELTIKQTALGSTNITSLISGLGNNIVVIPKQAYAYYANGMYSSNPYYTSYGDWWNYYVQSNANVVTRGTLADISFIVISLYVIVS